MELPADLWRGDGDAPEAGGEDPRLVFGQVSLFLPVPLPHAHGTPTAPRPKALKALLSLSLTPTELTLLTTYALSPPSSLPPTSLPIIHDLIFVYLVQNAQYVDAVKVAAKFAASALSTRPEVRKAVEEREGVVRELRACVPKVVRDGMGDDVRPKPKAKNKTRASAKGGEAVAIDAPPVPENRLALTNGHNAKYKDMGYATLFPANLLQQPQNTPLVIPAPGPVQPSRFVPRVEAYRPPVLSAQSPTGGAQNGHKAPNGNGKGPGQLSSSLFGSTSKATQVRNAFYNPPTAPGVNTFLASIDLPKSDGAKTEFTRDGGEMDQDAAMDTDDDELLLVPSRPRPALPEEPEPEPGLEYSLFSAAKPRGAQYVVPPLELTSSRNAPRKSDTTPKKNKKEEKQVLPGAFTQTDCDHDYDLLEVDVEPEQQQERRTSARRRASSPPSSPPAQRQPRVSASKGKGKVKEKEKKQPVDLGRSIPGRFEDDDDLLEDEEEEDDVPALPQVAPTPARAKKGRASTGTGAKDVGGGGEGPVRRSSRLSITPSVDYLDVGRKTPKRKSGPAGKKA